MKTEWSTYSLVDTNVLVYAIDTSDEFKHVLANELFESSLFGNIRLAVSTQILSELANVCLRLSKSNPGIDTNSAEMFISSLVKINELQKLIITPNVVLHAIKLQRQFNVGFYDSLIAATMKEHGILTIYTEDRSFEKIDGLKVVNPFESKHGG